MKSIFYVCLLFLATSCTRHCHDYAVMGADEFVTDSYKIRQGKTAILEMEGTEVVDLPEDAMEEYKDVIAEDDILNIAIYHPSRKDLMESFAFINHNIGGFRVYNGHLDLPDIPSVQVEGLNLDEAREKIQGIYREQIRDISVWVHYKDRLKSKVELNGLVGVKEIPVDGKIRLFEVLGKAHIPPVVNLFKSYVLRDGCQLNIDLHKLLNEGDMCQNIVMRGGDKIFIANTHDATAMVMGEVMAPRSINLPYGFVSLRQALVEAGGIDIRRGDRSHIQVIRGNLQCPKIYVLAWEHIVHLPNDSLLLMPGDTVYVSTKPITQWNDFISQLLETGRGAYGVHEMYKFSKDIF